MRYKSDLEMDKQLLKSQILEYESRIMQFKTDMERDHVQLLQLQGEIMDSKQIISSLQSQIQKEKMIAEENKNRDTQLISQLRIKLNESLEHKNKKDLVQTPSRNNNASQNEELHDQKTILLLVDRYEREQKQNLELQEKIAKVMAEKNTCDKELNILRGENEKLKKDLTRTQDENNDLMNKIEHLNEELRSCVSKDGNDTQSILRSVTGFELKRNEQQDKSEIKNLRRELAGARRDIVSIGLKELQPGHVTWLNQSSVRKFFD